MDCIMSQWGSGTGSVGCWYQYWVGTCLCSRTGINWYLWLSSSRYLAGTDHKQVLIIEYFIIVTVIEPLVDVDVVSLLYWAVLLIYWCVFSVTYRHLSASSLICVAFISQLGGTGETTRTTLIFGWGHTLVQSARSMIISSRLVKFLKIFLSFCHKNNYLWDKVI